MAPGMFEKKKEPRKGGTEEEEEERREEGETTFAGSSKMLNTVKRRFVSRREGRCQSVKRLPRMKSTPERLIFGVSVLILKKIHRVWDSWTWSS